MFVGQPDRFCRILRCARDLCHLASCQRRGVTRIPGRWPTRWKNSAISGSDLALRCQLNCTAKTPLPTLKTALKAAVGRPRFAPCRPPSTLFVRASGAIASPMLSDFHALAVVENGASDARTFPAG